MYWDGAGLHALEYLRREGVPWGKPTAQQAQGSADLPPLVAGWVLEQERFEAWGR